MKRHTLKYGTPRLPYRIIVLPGHLWSPAGSNALPLGQGQRSS